MTPSRFIKTAPEGTESKCPGETSTSTGERNLEKKARQHRGAEILHPNLKDLSTPSTKKREKEGKYYRRYLFFST